MDFEKILKFCEAKYAVNRIERQSTEQEKISANPVPEKIYRTHKLNGKQHDEKKWARDLIEISPQRCANGQWGHEKMLNIMNQQGMQIKATVRRHLAAIR